MAHALSDGLVDVLIDDVVDLGDVEYSPEVYNFFFSDFPLLFRCDVDVYAHLKTRRTSEY